MLANLFVGAGLDADGIVSPDEYRRVVTGDRANQTANATVFTICNLIADARLNRGLHVFYDATNLSTLEVHRERADRLGADIIYVKFPVDVAELLRRNCVRANPVPLDILQEMIENANGLRSGQMPGSILSPGQAIDWAEEVKLGAAA